MEPNDTTNADPFGDDTERDDHNHVGIIGSPSSTIEINVDVPAGVREQGLVGSMVVVTKDFADGAGEIGLSTVTDVETRNVNFEAPATRGIVSMTGALGPGLDGAHADVRAAEIQVQAVYTRNADGTVEPHGAALSMSPQTGTPVRRVDNRLLARLAEGSGTEGHPLYALGDIYRMPGVHLPMNTPDFNTARGAAHSGFFGASGAGKAAALDTPVPTPDGFVELGDIGDGDTVFDEDGNPCTVVKAHDVLHDRDCFVVEFSDGSTFTADADHLWFVETRASRMSQSRERTGERARAGVLDDDTVARLREMARNADPDEVLTVGDAFALVEGEVSKSWVKSVAAELDPAGTTSITIPMDYDTQTVTKSRRMRTWPVRVLSALADELEGRTFAGADAPAVLRRAAESVKAERVSLPEVADLLDVPRRNGHLRRLLNATGVPSETTDHTSVYELDGYTVDKPRSGVTAYDRRSMLLLMAAVGQRPRNDQRDKQNLGEVVTTRQMLALMESGELLSVPVAKPLKLPAPNLPVGPYTLGYWLGDGVCRSGAVCTADPEVLTYIEAEGYDTSLHKSTADQTCKTYTVLGIKPRLRDLGVLSPGRGNQKFIPDAYLFSSEPQRRALLAGLLDSDGNATNTAAVEFSNSNPTLIRDVVRLAASLGYRPTVRDKTVTDDDGNTFESQVVTWSTDDDVFRLERKRLAHKQGRANFAAPRNTQRYVVDVEPTGSVPVRCLTVDSPNRLFLIGDTMVPTHNTFFATYYMMSQMRHKDMSFLVIDPQRQFTQEVGMLPGSIQGLAEAQGRNVHVIDLLWDVQFDKNSELFTTLLSKTKFIRPYLMSQGKGTNVENLQMAVKAGLKQFDKDNGSGPDWTEATPEDLTDFLIDYLLANVGKIYTSADAVERLTKALEQYQADPTDLLEQVKPVQLLFKEINPDGTQRISEHKMFADLFERTGDPRAYVVVNMSADGMKKVAGQPGFDRDITTRLTDEGTKARLLNHLFQRLEREGENAYATAPLTSSGARQTLNVMVMFDEAARYAPHKTDDHDIGELASNLGRYARETRKVGIGWTYILQEPHQMERSVWEQLSSGFRAVGYGLGGRSAEMLRELLPDSSPLKLYRSFPSPAGSHKHNFMLMGSVSPLSFTTAPVFCTAVESLEDWVIANPWLSDVEADAVRFDLTGLVEEDEVSEEEGEDALAGLTAGDHAF